MIKIHTIIFTVFFYSLFSQNIETARSHFNNNNRSESLAEFTKLKDVSAHKNEALLSLILLEINNRHYDLDFDHLKEFSNSNKNIDPYLYALWNTGLFTQLSEKKTQEAVVFLNSYMEKDITASRNTSIQAMIHGYLGDHLFRQNNFTGADIMYKNINDLKNWSTVGTFENMSGSGFNKGFGAIEHPEPAFDFKNKISSNVRWYEIKDIRHDRWLDHEYHFDVSNSIIYSQTFLQSQESTEVILMAGVSGSIKIWVNDLLVIAESEERNTDLDVYQAKIQLNSGNNRILVQTGSSDIDRNNYMIRLADLKGNVITNPICTAIYTPYQKSKPYTSEPIHFWAEKYFEEQPSTDLISQILLLHVYNHNDKRMEARQIATNLKKLAPKNTVVSELVCDALSRDDNYTDLKKEYEAVKNTDPESYLGLTLQYNDAEETEDYDKCQTILNKIESLYGSNENTRASQISIFSKKKEYKNSIEAIESGYLKFPYSRYFCSAKYNLEKNVKKNVKSSLKILENYCKKKYSEDFKSTLINDYFEMGNSKKGFEMLEEMARTYPFSILYCEELAKRYDNIQDYTKAIFWIDKAIEIAPYIGSLYFEKGIYQESNRNKIDAEKLYTKALYFSPEISQARKKLYEIRGQKDVFSYFKSENIDQLVKESPNAIKFPEENSLYLLSDVQQVIYPENGVSEQKHHYLIKILNQKGIELWKELNIPVLRSQRLVLEKAELYKADGKNRVPAETDYSQVVFSSLEVGDVIHIYYKLESVITGKLAEHFWEDQILNGEYPYLISRYSLIVPNAKKFSYKTYNINLKPEVSNIDNDNTLYIWERRDIPAIKQEPFMPPLKDICERISVSSIPDWDYVANWYKDLSGVKTKGDYEVKQLVKQLFENKKNLTSLEKAKTIYKYIEENYNYSNIEFLHSALTPQSASRTIRTKLGDCKDLSTLFVAMCKEIGIDANLILVDTRDNGDTNLDLPSIGFNHCIAQFKNEGKNHIIELTNNFLPFGAMSNDLINTNGLYIPKDGETALNSSLTRLNTTSRPQNLALRTTEITISGKNATINRNSNRTGVHAAAIRYDYRNTGIEDQKKNLAISISSDFNKNIKIGKISFNNLDNLEDTISFNYDFTMEGFITDLAGLKVFSLPWADAFHTQDFVALENREYDFLLWEFNNSPYNLESITVNIPEGKKLIETPKNVSLTGPGITYSLTYLIKGDILTVDRRMEYLQDVIKKEDYLKFKEFITKVNEYDSMQYAYK